MMMPAHYQIRVRGYLDQDWQDWFHGLTISYPEEDVTALHGFVIDQSALHGLLNQLYGLGLPLLSVNNVSAADQDMQPPIQEG